MGWFTNKTTKWELQQSWLSIFAIVFPFGIPFFAMLYMGFRAKIKALLGGSLLYGIVFSLWVGNMIFNSSQSLFSFLNISLAILCFLSGPVLLSVYLQRFLRRVDLKGFIVLKWSLSYDYVDFMRRNSISNVLSVSSFVDSLNRWKLLIENNQVKADLDSMIHLTTEITGSNKHISELFIERHAFSIENILQQYSQVERSKIDNAVMREAELKLRQTLSLAVKAFKEELSNQRNFRNLDIEIEADVYLQDLKNKRIL